MNTKLTISVLIFILTLFNSCRDSAPPYYVIDKIRIPTAQIYSQTSLTGQGCITRLFDTSTWCQQFPIRPSGVLNAAAPGKVKLRFLSLAPEGSNVTLTITHLKVFDLGLLFGTSGNGARGINPNSTAMQQAKEIPISDLDFHLNTTLSTSIQTSPMQVQTIVFDLKPPSLNSLILYAQQYGFFPAFVISYTASAPGQTYIDNGIFTFFILPAPEDSASWGALQNGLANIPNVTSNIVAQAYELASLNVPIQINQLSPSSGSLLRANADNNISGSFSYNPSSFSYSPVQWYVSAGSLKNDKAAVTTWNPGQAGNVTAVFVARDLLGGVDFSISNFVAQ